MRAHERLWTLIALALVLALSLIAVAGCNDNDATDEPVAEETSAQETGDAATDEVDAGDSWMVGTWEVVHTLVSVTPDESWSRQAADQPGTTLEISVDGDQMTIADDDTSYTAVYVIDDDGFWHFDGTDTTTDSEGVVWTSHLILDVTKVDDDAFTAEQWGEISSDTEGVLYEAEWIADGVRTE